ncbi:MAG: hypothetical protein IJM47_08640 [Synergistaceae bacterium]|nr:hypothetical protein [Synergistaceae bacterium]
MPFSTIIAQNADPFYSPENQAYVMKSVQELREGKGQTHELIEEYKKIPPDSSSRRGKIFAHSQTPQPE